MTPVTSMTVAPASWTRSPSASGPDSKLLTGPLGRISSDAMTTMAFSSLAPFDRALHRISYHEEDNTAGEMKKYISCFRNPHEVPLCTSCISRALGRRTDENESVPGEVS